MTNPNLPEVGRRNGLLGEIEIEMRFRIFSKSNISALVSK